MLKLRTAGLLVVLLVSSTALAWDGAGHMVTAAVAYRQLSPAEKSKVDAVLSHHPEAARWDEDRARYRSDLDVGEYRFLRAAKWPDEIKRKRGWPNRSNWHYANTPITSATSPMGEDPGAKHNIMVGLRKSEETLRDSGASAEDRAIALAFVIHLVGDLHQPLHMATAITPSHPGPKGDAGGNATMIRIRDSRTVKLHEFWDDLAGKSKDPDDADHQAIELLHRISAASVTSAGTEADWARESWRLAQTTAYPAGIWTQTGDAPVDVDESYIRTAKATGERQMVVGGVRLAAVIRRAVP